MKILLRINKHKVKRNSATHQKIEIMLLLWNHHEDSVKYGISYYFPIATIINYHKLSVLININLLPYNSVVEKLQQGSSPS